MGEGQRGYKTSKRTGSLGELKSASARDAPERLRLFGVNMRSVSNQILLE